MSSITTLVPQEISLEVTWADGGTSRYPWIWLRDHAHDDATLHPLTQQRQLFTAGLATLGRGSARLDGDSLLVEWPEHGEVARLPILFLQRHREPAAARATVTIEPTLWDGAVWAESPPTVPYDDVIGSDDGLQAWLRATFEFGFCIATGTPATAAATEALIRRIGYVRETIFGGMWEFEADLTKADTAYTNLELRPHTDGTYSHDAPGVQLLHCLQFDGTGGESSIVDGFALAARLADQYPEDHATLSTVMVPGQYIGDGSHLVAARPVLRHDHTGALVQVSFNNYDRAPFLLAEQEMVAFYRALTRFDLLANDLTAQWRHVLAPGEALLFDNWRVLHGRLAYTGRRRLCGGYVNREDVESALRRLS